MTTPAKIWMRNETLADETGAPTEHRAPLTPHHAYQLIKRGTHITVETSAHRIFSNEQYHAVGCVLAEPNSWVNAPHDTVILGLKELPPLPASLQHTHIYFGHAYKGQRGGQELLERFHRGGGTLLDLEELVDPTGKRLTTFGYWAGYVGAALAVLHARGHIKHVRHPMARTELDVLLQQPAAASAPDPHAHNALIIGARGRSGHGAYDALTRAGFDITSWNRPETVGIAERRKELLGHAILVNAIATRTPVASFLTRRDLHDPHRRLRTISDVTCDMNDALNVLREINTTTTSWANPVRRLKDLDVIAIDNLPSALPMQASLDFSQQLATQLLSFSEQNEESPWLRAERKFRVMNPSSEPAPFEVKEEKTPSLLQPFMPDSRIGFAG